jgi:hypothetical protein
MSTRKVTIGQRLELEKRNGPGLGPFQKLEDSGLMKKGKFVERRSSGIFVRSEIKEKLLKVILQALLIFIA